MRVDRRFVVPGTLGALASVGAAALMIGPGHASDPWPFVLLGLALACTLWMMRLTAARPG